MVSELDRCKRLLVSLILALGRTYDFAINITRDSEDAVVKRAYRQASRKVNRDHGGSIADQQRLNGAYEAWCEAGRSKGPRGRPAAGVSLARPVPEAGGAEPSSSKPFEFRAQAVLFTYQGFKESVQEALEQWSRFVAWVSASVRLLDEAPTTRLSPEY